MKKLKSALSVLLAMLVVLSVVSAGFVGASAATPPIVPREKYENPVPTITAPATITVQGSNQYVSGNSVQAGKSVSFSLPGATAVRVEENSSGLSLGIGGDPIVSGDVYTWEINPVSTATPNSYVYITFGYIYGGVTYYTTAYIWADPAHVGASVTNNTSRKPTAWLNTAYTNHTLSVYPAYGSAVSVSNDSYASGYFNYASSSFAASTSAVTGMQWTNSSSSDGTRTMDTAYSPTATAYINSAGSALNMQDTELVIAERIHGGSFETQNGIDTYRRLEDLYVGNNASYGTTFNGNSVKFTESDMGRDLTYKLTGPVPGAGRTVSLEIYDNFMGRVHTAGEVVTTSFNSIVGLKVRLIGYDKTQLNGLVNNEKNRNRQSFQLGSRWSTYEAAFANAYAINAKPNATQSEIDSAYQTLYAVVYNTLGDGTVANYKAADALIYLLRTRAIYYPDRMAYYTAESGGALLDALADIYYDYHALISSQQNVVNQMATNLRRAMNNLEFAWYSVSFDADTPFIDPISYEVNSTVTHPGIPIKEGWEFDGWYYDTGYEQPVQWPIIMPAKNFTVYAKWIRITSFIYFDSNGGTAVPDYEGGIYDPYTGPTVTPTKTGYTFSRWYFDSALTAPVNWSVFTMPAISRTLYAGWTIDQHTVSFNTFVSTQVEPITQDYWTSVEEPEAPLFESKRFDAWYYDEQLADKVIWPFPMPGEDITLYAKWIEDQYTITFVTPEDTVNAPETIWANYNQSIYMPTAPTRAGYTFGGWYYDDELSQAVTWSNFRMPNRNLVLHAKWAAKQSVFVFNSDGGTSVKAIRLPVGTLVDEPDTPTKEGMLFVAWARSDGTYVSWPAPMPAATTVLKAVWRDMPDMYSYRLEATTESGSYVLRQGDTVDFDVYLKTNYNLGSFNAVIYYDARYFEPAVGGSVYTDRFFTGITNDDGFFKRGYNFPDGESGYNAWQVGAVRGSVNDNRVIAYYPSAWRSGTNLSSQYSNYRYIWFNVLCSQSTSQTGGVCMEIDPEQKVFSFQLRVRDTAPATGEGIYTSVMMPEVAAYSETNTSGQIYAVKKAGSSASSPNIQTGIEYDLSEGTKSFQISERERYVIFFDTNGSPQSIDPITLSEGYSIDLPELEDGPRKSSMFAGWSLGGVRVSDPFIMPAGNVTLKALWEAEYITSYYQMDTSGNYGTEPEYTVYSTAVVNSTVTANLIEFDGFTYNPTLSADTVSGVVFDSDVEIANTDPVEYQMLHLKVYYDRKLVTITYNPNGGVLQGGISSTTAYFDSAVAAPPDPIRTGFAFVAWTYNGNVFRVSRMPANDMELIALWDTRKYLVKFYVGDAGSPHFTCEGYYGETIEFPDMTLEGQRFSGWFADWAYYTPFTLTTIPDRDISVYGYYLPSGYTITFFLNGNRHATYKAEAGTEMWFPGDCVREGYEFSGWYTDQGYTIPFTSEVVPDRDMNLYAKNTINKYTITYYLNGEQYLQPYVRNYQAPIVLASVAAPSGYEFSGWYSDPELTELFTKSRMPAENFSLYGELIVKKYTITFFIDGVPDDTLTLTDYYNSEITLPIPETEVVYDFDGWYYDAELTYKAELETMPGEDTDLYGALVPATLTITYYMDGLYYSEKGIVYNTSIVHITDPVKQYATFDGWYFDPDCTQSFNLTVMPAAEFNLYGRFIPDPATITFDLNGGSGTCPSNILTGVGLTVTLPVPVNNSFYMTNYKFAGWGETANTTSAYAINGEYTVPPGGKTFFAIWKAVAIEILPAEGSTTVIDDSRSYIYGLKEMITQREFLDSFVEVQGNGRLAVSNSGGNFGTGSTVRLINNVTGSIIKTYTIIIFGDINGDAKVDSLDISAVSRAAANLDVLLGYRFFAANINGDIRLDTLDLSVISRDSAGLAIINQANPAGQ